MSDFSDKVKYLDVVKARKATIDEVKEEKRKYFSVTKSRAIKKIYKYIVLPAAPVDNGWAYYSQGSQYNFTAPQAFRILNANTDTIGDVMQFCLLTVKWRVGSTVHRYYLSIGPKYLYLNPAFTLGMPKYTNELIPANCCFELLNAGGPQNELPQFGTNGEIQLQTSLLINPSNAEEVQYLLPEPTFQDYASIVIGTFPIDFTSPLDNTNNAWLDNP